MHRILKAVAMDLPIRIPLDFDIDKAANLAFKIPLSKDKFLLRIKVKNLAAKYLAERALSKDQAIERIDENWSLVTATVDDTQHLKTWVLSLGPDIVVESPENLKDNITVMLREMVSQYSDNGA
jgi:predicted DNA-binding transcriptional regulator YafY